ncbi:hypothetical protein PG999_003642 [Apiospora kogelbergensis]|uniref:Cryptic loci regulator 2 N-terminal domain-containing protein n=1 Tax=Apiospora kogelbergensis TaxID=1337665 RepID=A0AAW0R426_9PEZI
MESPARNLPQQTGQDYLELLVNTDFNDAQDLWFAHAVRTKYHCQSLVMFEHTPSPEGKGRKRPKDSLTHQYTVEVDHEAPNHLGASYRPSSLPESNQPIDLNKPEQLFESMVLSLEVTPPKLPRGRTSKYSRRQEQEPSPIKFPRFVVEIGEIRVETWDNHEIRGSNPEHVETRSIACHMVMDIEPPFNQRTLWLVYRYRGVEDGNQLMTDRKWDRDVDLFGWLGLNTWENVTRGTSASFDIAQLATSAEDWYKENGECKPIKNLEELMKKTAMQANCRLTTPKGLFKEFKARGV